MIQTWVALPEKDEETLPSFDNYKSEQLPIYTDKGIWMRLIAGNAYGLRSDVKTNSPLFYVHTNLQQGARFNLPERHSERGIYIAKGSIEISGRNYTSGQMVVFSKTEQPVLIAREPSTLMLLGGEPLGERFIWWNFVSSSRERIEQAKSDWKEGRILLPPRDNREFIPLPQNHSRPLAPPPPEPLS